MREARLRTNTHRSRRGQFTPMLNLQFRRATLLGNFIARQNRKCEMACRVAQRFNSRATPFYPFNYG